MSTHSTAQQERFEGLSAQDVRARQQQDGYNELPSSHRRTLLSMALEVLREPMFALLLACGAIYFTIGDAQEALILLGFVLIVAATTLYQEHKTERALEALRDLSSPRALVIRESRRQRIAGREVVRGDVLVLSEGDRIPADSVVLLSSNLTVDESLLTGESAPVRKTAGTRTTALSRPGKEDQATVYAGTLVTSGSGLAEARATGPRTEMGRIGGALQTVTPERTRLQRETGRLVRVLAIVGVLLCVIVVVTFALTRRDWLGGFLAGLTLAMAILPNEFPAVLAIFLALGAWRISRNQVLTRRVPALETLGAATVLCVDKTGTLTLNEMRIQRLFSGGRFFDTAADAKSTLPEEFHEVVEYGLLASQREPFDPMEKAFQELGQRRLAGTEHLHPNWSLVREYPLSPELLALSHVWRSPVGQDYVIAAKGAPEAVADLCHLPEQELRDLQLRVAEMAADGLRVLGVARAHFRPVTLPARQHDFDFELVGLVGLADPLRPTVPTALAECAAARVRVVMITGDHPQTALAIARQAGLPNASDVLTGSELEQLDGEALRRRLRTVNVFARVIHEQKLLIVRALQADGEVVAMTGDGVNDAPALKAADIGIAMGGRGTDVARESAALIVLDDDFSSIVRAVRLGRRIFSNLTNAMAYVLAIHVPIAGLTLAPVLFKLPLMLLPVQIAFLHLIIEPACSVAFEVEPEDPEIMRHPPRSPHEPLFSRRLVGLSLLQGAAVLCIVLAILFVTIARGQGELEARGLSFTTLIVANLALIFANRSWTHTFAESLRTPNRALWGITAGALVLLGLALYVPALRSLFRMSFLHGDDLLLCLGAGLVSVGWFELLKIFRRRPRAARTAAQEGRTG
jgi:Ca2+-transporting ATPase